VEPRFYNGPIDIRWAPDDMLRALLYPTGLERLPNTFGCRPILRKALATLAKYVQHRHPLVEQAFQTNRRDLFIEHLGKVVNLSKDEQILIPGVMELYLERIELDPQGLFKFYPFLMEKKANEPKLIQMNPAVGFGKAVIAGTGISTAVVVSRFNARESVPDLASEYGVTPEQIEEAIRWDQRTAAIAA
jgi:uncharacterized protein (DUF433 family)